MVVATGDPCELPSAQDAKPVREGLWLTPYRLPATNALKPLSLDAPTAVTE